MAGVDVGGIAEMARLPFSYPDLTQQYARADVPAQGANPVKHAGAKHDGVPGPAPVGGAHSIAAVAEMIQRAGHDLRGDKRHIGQEHDRCRDVSQGDYAGAQRRRLTLVPIWRQGDMHRRQIDRSTHCLRMSAEYDDDWVQRRHAQRGIKRPLQQRTSAPQRDLLGAAKAPAGARGEDDAAGLSQPRGSCRQPR